MKYEWLNEYLLSKEGSRKDFKVEWQWNRYLVGDRMFGAVCSDKDGKPIVTLKCEPTFAQMLRSQYAGITPGYYMNKEHWNSVYLDGAVPDEVLKQMIDQSYQLVFCSLTRKMQNQITGESKTINKKQDREKK